MELCRWLKSLINNYKPFTDLGIIYIKVNSRPAVYFF
jgi:hypothetical protein